MTASASDSATTVRGKDQHKDQHIVTIPRVDIRSNNWQGLAGEYHHIA